MLKYSEIPNAFQQQNINAVEYNIEDDGEIVTPYVVYVATDGDRYGADGLNYVKFLNVRLALIDQSLDKTMMSKIENVLDSACQTYDKNIEFDDDERLYSIGYTFVVIDDSNEI